MGACYQFTCPGCGYSAEVSGGRGVGMDSVVQTMVCQDCHALVDVLIGRYGKDGPTGDPDYDKAMGQCPLCEKLHLTAWMNGGACPKCSQAMTQGPLTTLWD